ncbi:MAG: hypothetical protein RL653_4159 [Pseudomonadota bacterium]
MKRALLLAVLSCVGCATAPVRPTAPCAHLERADSALRLRYPRELYVVGVGVSTGAWNPEDARAKAEASAKANVAAQLVVNVRSSFTTATSASTSEGSSEEQRWKVEEEVEAVDLPGLSIVETCTDPGNLATTSLVVLERRPAAAAIRGVVAELEGRAQQLLPTVMEGLEGELPAAHVREAQQVMQDLRKATRLRTVAHVLGAPVEGPSQEEALRGLERVYREAMTVKLSVVPEARSGQVVEPFLKGLKATPLSHRADASRFTLRAEAQVQEALRVGPGVKVVLRVRAALLGAGERVLFEGERVLTGSGRNEESAVRVALGQGAAALEQLAAQVVNSAVDARAAQER